MGKKVYAVRKGTVPGIYATWAECEAQVRGVSGAEYKGFKSEAEARAWLGEADDSPAPAAPAPAAPPGGPPPTAAPPHDLPPWALPEGEAKAAPVPPTPPPSPVPEPPPPPAAPDTEYRQQLDEKAAAFLAYLQEQGVAAYAASGGSQHHERIGIEGGGWVDLYHTRKKPFSPKPMMFKDSALRDRVMELWQAFHLGGGMDNEVAQSSPWDAVDHYYGLLQPYAALRFDFLALARALRNAAPEAPDPDAVRYDFGQIEAAYRQLRPQTA